MVSSPDAYRSPLQGCPWDTLVPPIPATLSIFSTLPTAPCLSTPRRHPRAITDLPQGDKRGMRTTPGTISSCLGSVLSCNMGQVPLFSGPRAPHPLGSSISYSIIFTCCWAAYRGQRRGHRGIQAWTVAQRHTEGPWGPWTWRLPGAWCPHSQEALACAAPRSLTFQCCLPSCCRPAYSVSGGGWACCGPGGQGR